LGVRPRNAKYVFDRIAFLKFLFVPMFKKDSDAPTTIARPTYLSMLFGLLRLLMPTFTSISKTQDLILRYSLEKRCLLQESSTPSITTCLAPSYLLQNRIRPPVDDQFRVSVDFQKSGRKCIDNTILIHRFFCLQLLHRGANTLLLVEACQINLYL
jgi:hypothetical protein